MCQYSELITKDIVMRCDNCGWMNPEGIDVCQKCSQKLRPAVCEPPVVSYEVEHKEVAKVLNCDKCGKEYSEDLTSCPHCGFANQKVKSAAKANGVDLNKTVAFGMTGFGASNVGAEKVEPAVSEPLPPAGLPFNVKDRSDLKKTVVVGRDDVAAPPVQPVQKPEQPKPAVKPLDLKATMVDVSAIALMQTVSDSVEDAKAPEKAASENLYTLHSMDHSGAAPIVLTITATENIGLKTNDIILINGIRYRAK